MSRFNKILGLSIVVAGAAFIAKVFSFKETNLPNDDLGKNSDSRVTNSSSDDIDDTTRAQKMYSDLSMTESQRVTYEESIKKIKDDWDKINPNDTIDAKSLSSEEDKSLKAVLNEVQYGMYRDWAERYEY